MNDLSPKGKAHKLMACSTLTENNDLLIDTFLKLVCGSKQN